MHNTNVYLIKYIHFLNILVQCCLYKYIVVCIILHHSFCIHYLNCSMLFLSFHNYSFMPEVF